MINSRKNKQKPNNPTTFSPVLKSILQDMDDYLDLETKSESHGDASSDSLNSNEEKLFKISSDLVLHSCDSIEADQERINGGGGQHYRLSDFAESVDLNPVAW